MTNFTRTAVLDLLRAAAKRHDAKASLSLREVDRHLLRVRADECRALAREVRAMEVSR